MCFLRPLPSPCQAPCQAPCRPVWFSRPWPAGREGKQTNGSFKKLPSSLIPLPLTTSRVFQNSFSRNSGSRKGVFKNFGLERAFESLHGQRAQKWGPFTDQGQFGRENPGAQKMGHHGQIPSVSKYLFSRRSFQEREHCASNQRSFSSS